MKYYLTSALINFNDRKLIKENNFIENLKKDIIYPCNFLFISNDPKNKEEIKKYSLDVKNALEDAGIKIEKFNILDNQNKEKVENLIKDSNLIFLAGGHIQTQNDFFKEINLKECIKEYKGILISCSAGSMNSANNVYSIPEREGEALDKDFKKILKGLGITNINMIPHYQHIRNISVDNYRYFEDILIPDSYKIKQYALVDGSYIKGEKNKYELIKGKAYVIENGNEKLISDIDEEYIIYSN